MAKAAAARASVDVELTAEQQAVLAAVEGGESHLLVTGRAGTGKSTLLNAIASTSGRAIAICAPTGVAALNVGGQTIHSLFRLPIGLIGPGRLYQDATLRSLLQRIDLLVIDEISMVDADLLDAVDRSLREARGRNLPFGGVQIVMFGDPYQLAPVPASSPAERDYLASVYRSPWFFDAMVWLEAELHVHELAQVHRQRDPEFRTLLSAVRHGAVTAEMAGRINSVGARPVPSAASAHSRDPERPGGVDQRSRARGPAGRPPSSGRDPERRVGRSHGPPADLELLLKPAAQVMMVRNDPDGRWVNGSLGSVVEVRQGVVRVAVNGTVHDVRPVTWERFKYVFHESSKTLEREVVADFTQLPIRLGWAVTIHKSQGTTLDSAIVDLGSGAFSPGQTYVALSRLRTLDGLYLARPMRPADVIVDAHVRRFVAERRAARAAAAAT